MDHLSVGQYWDANADAWTRLSRAGHDVLRDRLNTPAFLASLPPIAGLRGLDVGCGEGHNTRLLARRGASMAAVDIAENFIRHAQAEEKRAPLGISYERASAVELPFADAAFDFTASFMCLMDIPELERVLAEVFRVLRPGGFFQFSILHPCFNPPHRRVLRDEERRAYALEVGDYFLDARGRVHEWFFGDEVTSARDRLPTFRIPRFHRPVSEWLNLLVAAGFRLEHFAEPRPDPADVELHRGLQDAAVAAYFLQVRARKPENA